MSQALSGTIVGTVTEQAGAVSPKAKVVLANEGTQFSRVVETNANGQCVAYSVPTGSYTVTTEAAGFQKLIRSGIQLTAADTLTADLQLTVGSVQQTMEVKAEATLVQSQTAQHGICWFRHPRAGSPDSGRRPGVFLTP